MIADKIVEACNLMLNTGKVLRSVPGRCRHQGGAGTSVNMNTNEVLANLALELMGLERVDYDVINPNDHVNKCQSTNDAYPTGFPRGRGQQHRHHLHALVKSPLRRLPDAKAKEFKHILKMGRAQLPGRRAHDPGSGFHAFAVTLREEIKSIKNVARSCCWK